MKPKQPSKSELASDLLHDQPEVKIRRRARPSAGAWTQDPDGVKKNILDVARREFVSHGLSGARVDEIAAKTATSKRMIYYYFGDKKGLYAAVLEEAYKRIRSLEIKLDLDRLSPIDAMKALVGFTFDYHADNPDFVRLVMVENIHYAVHLKASKTINVLNQPVIKRVSDIYERGLQMGSFRPGLDPLDIHLTITALSFYNGSNRETILQVFDHDMAEQNVRARRRAAVIDIVSSYLARNAAP